MLFLEPPLGRQQQCDATFQHVRLVLAQDLLVEMLHLLLG